METEIRIAVHLKEAEERGTRGGSTDQKEEAQNIHFLGIMELLCLDLRSHLAYSHVKSLSFTSKICALFCA